MKILQFSCYSSWGGAPKVAYTLHRYINEKTDNCAFMFCRTKTDNSPNIIQFYPGTAGRIYRVGIDRLERLTSLQYFFQKSFKSIENHPWFQQADIVHFHNTHGGYLNQWFLPEVAKRKPVVWTLHDMWALTGSCAHPFDCEKWKTGCGKCPCRFAYPPTLIDTSAYLWNLKAGFYKTTKPFIVCPSEWLQKKVAESFLSHCPRTVIKNSIDTSIYHPFEKNVVRKELNLPQSRKILFFAAQRATTTKLKGFDYFINALKLCYYSRGLKPYALVAGNGKKFDFASIGLDGCCLGAVNDEQLMAKYYSAADALIVSSVAENVPLVIAESLACGTPSIAFATGGIPEMIEHKKTGFLAEHLNTDSLAEGIKWLADTNQYQDVSSNCRKFALKEYSTDNQINKYMKLYTELVSK